MQYTTQDLDLLLKELSCKSISDDNKLDIMHQAVTPCPEIVMTIKGKPTKSLLDSGSECTLMNESYFKDHIKHRLLPSSGLYNNSHNLFNLKGVEEGHILLTRHFEVDIKLGGQLVHCVGILVKKNKVPLMDSKGRKAKTLALLGSNLIRIALNEFCETFGEEPLCLFECPIGMSPLWFSTLCLHYYAHIFKKPGVGASSVKTDDPSNDKDEGNNEPNLSRSRDSKSQNEGNNQAKPESRPQENKSKQKDHGKQCHKKIDTLSGYASRIMIGDKRQPICILAGMSKVVVGRTQGKLPKG